MEMHRGEIKRLMTAVYSCWRMNAAAFTRQATSDVS